MSHIYHFTSCRRFNLFLVLNWDANPLNIEH